LGASRGRLVRQLLTEGFFLAGLGGALAVLLTLWSGDLLRSFGMPLDLDMSPGLRAFAYTLAACLTPTSLFRLLPTPQATRRDLLPSLSDAPASSSFRPSRLRSGLSVAQLGLSLVLLVTAGLFLRSVQKAQAIDPGFDPSGVLVFAVDPGL